MALYPPRAPGTDAFDPHLQQRRLGGRRLRQRHALRRRAGRRGDRQDRADLRDRGRPRHLLAGPPTACSPSTWAAPRFRWNEIPLARGISAIPARSNLQIGPIDAPVLHSPSVGQHGQSARDLLGRRCRRPTTSPASARCSNTIRCFPSAPISRSPQRRRATHRDPHLGARRRPDPGLRLGGLRRRGRRGAARPHRPQGDGDAARRRPRHRMARGRRPCADDRPGRITSIKGQLRSRRCSPTQARGAA